MALVFGFEIIVSLLIVVVLIAAPIAMLAHVFRTLRLRKQSKRLYPDSEMDQQNHFSEHLYK